MKTDGIHVSDNVPSGQPLSPESLSEGIKRLKMKYVKDAIDKHQMDQAIIFCRTKLDCDNLERYLLAAGKRQGGGRGLRAVP